MYQASSYMYGSRNFCQRGSKLTVFSFFFSLVDEKRDDKIPLKAGHHRPASETPFKWRFAGMSMMFEHCMNSGLVAFFIFQGIRTSIAKKPLIFVILWGVRTLCPPSGSVHELTFLFPPKIYVVLVGTQKN